MSPTEPLSVELLLQHENFLRAVVRGLLPDDSKVQDVLQETWLRALHHPPTAGGSPKAWLARVASNLAKDARRGESRRRRREEQVARPEACEDVDIAQRQLAAQQEVVGAALGLQEPYKSVVLLRYYHALTPAEIGRRLGSSPATVRSQLSRAHALLREELDRRHGGDRSAWCGILAAKLLVAQGTRRTLAPALLGTVSVGALVLLAGWGIATLLSQPEERSAVRSAREPDTLLPPGAGDRKNAQALDPGTSIQQGAVDTPPRLALAEVPASDVEIPPTVSGTLWLGADRLDNESFRIFHYQRALDPEDAQAASALTSDAGGRFLYSSPLLSEPCLSRELTLTLTRSHPDRSPMKIRIELPNGPLSGMHELGDVSVPLAQFVAAGIVVTPLGEALPRASITISWKASSGARGRSREHRSADEEGRFSFYEETPRVSAYRIRVQHPGYQDGQQALLHGDAELRIVLKPLPQSSGTPVSVVGKLLLDSDIDPKRLEVRLSGPSIRFGVQPDEEGEFRFAEIQPGGFELDVFEWTPSAHPEYHPTEYPEPGGQKPIVRSPRPRIVMGIEPPLFSQPVDVSPRVSETEARLPTQDLRDLIQRVELRCQDPAGAPLPGVQLEAFDAADRARIPPPYRAHPWKTWEFDEEGRLDLIQGIHGTSVFEFTTEGFAPRLLDSLSDGQIVTLQRRIVVRVEAPLVQHLRAGDQLSVVLTPIAEASDGASESEGFSAFLDKHGHAELAVDAEGDHALALHLIHASNHTTHRIQLGLELQVISITRDPQAGPLALVTTYTPAELESAYVTLEKSLARAAKDERRR